MSSRANTQYAWTLLVVLLLASIQQKYTGIFLEENLPDIFSRYLTLYIYIIAIIYIYIYTGIPFVQGIEQPVHTSMVPYCTLYLVQGT